MERESFENEEIGRLLNDLFVSIKVDREERPDVDRVYMSFVHVRGVKLRFCYDALCYLQYSELAVLSVIIWYSKLEAAAILFSLCLWHSVLK